MSFNLYGSVCLQWPKGHMPPFFRVHLGTLGLGGLNRVENRHSESF